MICEKERHRFKMNKYFYGIGFLFLLISIGCDRPTKVVHTYHEFSSESPRLPNATNTDPHAFMHQMPNDEIHANLKFGSQDMSTQLQQSVAPASFTWTTPSGWLEQPGSGMRVVSFISKDKGQPVETTVISLAGKAGGIAANATRWLQQLNVSSVTPEEINQFIKRQETIKTSNGFSIVILDFTTWPGLGDSATPSMIAAVLDKGDAQIFFKMTGTVESLQKNSNAFKSLLQSLNFKEGS